MGRNVLASEIEVVDSVTGGVTLGSHSSSLAGIEVVRGDFDGSLKGKRVFDKGGDQTRDDMPLNMAMEQPDTFVDCQFQRIFEGMKRRTHQGCRP